MTTAPTRVVRTRTRPAPAPSANDDNVVPFAADHRANENAPACWEDPDAPEGIRYGTLAEAHAATASARRIVAQRSRHLDPSVPAAELTDDERRRRGRALSAYGPSLMPRAEDEPDVAQPVAAPPQRMSDIEARETEWMWHPYVPRGMMTVLAGRGGRGKGLVLADLAARVTTGAIWPNSLDPAGQGNVLWVEGEDPAPQVLKPRFEAAGADCGRIIYMKPHEFRGVLDIGAFLREQAVRLIVLSPLTSSLCLRDSAKDEDVRRALEPLHDAIEAAGSALIGIMHLNKKADLDAVERLLGSVAFANFVRSVLLVEQEPEADHSIRRMAHGKWNVATKGADLLYTSRYVGDDPRGRDQRVRIAWSVPDGGDIDANRLFDRPRATGGTDRRDARGWLVQYLAEHGPCNSSDVLAAGEDAGYSRSAVRQARQRHHGIHVERTREAPARVIWSLLAANDIDGETT